MIHDISTGESRNNARFYSVEVAEILGAHLNSEIGFLNYASQSKELINWFADEDNIEKKAAAYEEMMRYAEILQIKSLYFVILDSLNEYSIENGALFEDFVSFNVLDPLKLYDQWFFDCINSDNEFTLWMDVDKITNTRRLWLNHKVMENGDVCGVFCSALQFDDIFNELFGRYDSKNVKGFIIDQNGFIKMDSSVSEPALFFEGVTHDEAQETRHILDVNQNRVFISAIKEYLERSALNVISDFNYGFFLVEPDITILSNSPYRYLATTPIPNTSWSTVILYSAQSLFNIRLLLQPLLVIMSVFLLYAAVSSELIKRMVFTPLKRLTGSVSSAGFDSSGIFGINRDDEIGELARTMQETWNHLNDYNAKLFISMRERERKARFLHAVNTMTAILLNAENESAFETSLPEGIRFMADCMNLDHVYIWRNEIRDGNLHFVQMYQWTKDISQEKNLVPAADRVFSYNKDTPQWLEQFWKSKCIFGPVNTMPSPERELLESYNIKSILAVPVYLHGNFWGFVSYDVCHEERTMQQDEIDILRSGSLIMVSAINRNEQEAALNQHTQLLQTLNLAASVLLNPKISEFENNLHHAMGIIANAVNADRVYIGKNYTHQGERYVTQIYEWTEDTGPLESDKYTLSISYRNNLPEWEEILAKGQCINSLVRNMSVESQAALSSQNILSIFVVPVFLHDQFWGFVGFDDCHQERIFTENEETIIRSSCLMIGNAFLRHDDVTEIVRLQADLEEALKEAQAASRAKSAFLANMSHEIRTPLNSIMGFSELALDDEVSSRTSDYLSKIIENAEWLLQIVNDILNISKIESGKIDMEQIPFDIHELFVSCKTTILPKAIEKGIYLHFFAEPSTGKMPLGDPTKLRHVLVNLLSNAVKFTNTGTINFIMEIKDKTEKTVTMHFEVKDSGIGMTKEQIDRIFEPFMQAESGTTRKYGGTGLGLAIAKNLIEIMGGHLSVDSTPGIGSNFFFDLTFDMIDITEDEAFAQKTMFNEIGKPAFEGEVLLCEDNNMNQQVICEHLARVGLKTVVAENGKIGVEFVQSRKEKNESLFNLIFMDMHMPVMDGLEASDKIHELGTDIPIVALTANVMSDDMEVYKSHGITDCLGKPFSSQELWRCLLKYFTPLSISSPEKKEQIEAENELQNKIELLFMKNNKNKYEEINRTLKEGDIKLAHRLTHTLKSNAGQIGRHSLQKIAAEVERQLKNGKNEVTPQQKVLLKTALEETLSQLEARFASKQKTPQTENDLPFDNKSALELLEKLEPLLKSSNSECLSFINSLYRIPGSEELIQQMESFDFEPASSTFDKLFGKLKEKLEIA
ncbi:MAG: response regulator [Treponema sp.]|nr:response regulator [Treponema sp.]